MSIAFLPAAALVARFCEWVVPDRPVAEALTIKPKFLDLELITTPALALDRVRREIGRLGDLVGDMLGASYPAVVTGTSEELDAQLAEGKLR